MRFLGADRTTPAGHALAGVPGRRPVLRAAFLPVTLFFTIGPLVNLLQHRPDPVPLALLLVGWAVFGVVVADLLRVGPFGRREHVPLLLTASAVLATIAVVTQAGFGVQEATALYFYAGVAAARVVPQSLAIAVIGGISLLAFGGFCVRGDAAAGLDIGITAGTISLTLSALGAQGRINRELHAARLQLAETAVADERIRIARDLHDTVGHGLSLIALKSELARRVLRDDPDRAAREIEDVERAAREALASVRETVSGYRPPTLAMELARARELLRSAGIAATVEPAPEGLPPDVDTLLGWAVREGVTNVLRHSGAATARIRVLEDPGGLTVEIVDDGAHRSAAAHRSAPGGFGLAGLRERAGALGGAVEAEPGSPGGFRLAVRVPVAATP